MNLDSVTAEIRPRESWEASDLGIALTRRDYGKILQAKMIVVWPVWGLMILLLHNHPWWLAISIWWLNAAWEKVTLYFISRSLFGGKETLRSFLKAWPGWFWKRLHFSLLTARFTGGRTLHLPAVMLEGIDNHSLARRAVGLRQYSGMISSKMASIFFLCLHSCWLQLVLLLYWLVPFFDWREVTTLLDGGEALPESCYWVCLGSYLLVFTLLTPFYVGAGFGMYINARTKMEGWDVELIFRKMAQRIATTAVLVLLGLAGIAYSQTEPAKVTTSPKQVMEKVLQDDAFTIQTRTEKRYVRKDRSRNRNWNGPSTDRDPNRYKRNRSGGSGGIDPTFIGWIALGAVGAYVLYLLTRILIGRFKSGPSIEVPQTETVMGMDVSQKSLPKDLITRSRELWQAGNTRESLALLYRGALSWLIYKGGVRIRESDTEIDCLNRTNECEEANSRANYFKALTSAWIKVAYGREKPTDTEMQYLFDNWPFEKGKSKALATTATSLLVATCLSGCGGYEVEEETTELGFKGKAKVYPFLAVERFLKEMSVDFERVYAFSELPSTESVVLYPSEVDTREDQAKRLLKWAEEGGSIIYLLDGTDQFTRWNESPKSKPEPKKDEDKDEKDKVSHPLLDQIKVQIGPKVVTETEVNWGKRKYQWSLGNERGFQVPKKMWNQAKTYRIGSDRKTVAAIQVPHGEGMLTLVGQAKPWRNRYVGDGDHATILWDILSRGKQKLDSVWLVRGSRASFWDLLMKYGWMPLISCAIYVLFWLWNSIPRFGPMIPDPVEGNRDFHEHLLMTGRFFIRKDMPQALVEPSQRRLSKKLKRFNLQAEDSDAEWIRLSETTGIPEDTLRWALEANEFASKKDYYQSIKILQLIDQKL